MASTSTVSVRVVVRIRPVNEREGREMQASKDSFSYAIESSGSSQTIAFTGKALPAEFRCSFDRVFDCPTTQEEMFADVLRPAIEDVLRGLYL